MNVRTSLLCTGVLIALGGCAAVGGFFEDEKPKPLEGERISVLELQKSLQPDAQASGAAQNIILPAATINHTWAQGGGKPDHVMQNLSLPSAGELSLIWRNDIGAGSTKKIPLTTKPVVVGNTVFTLDTGAVVSAFNATDGKRLWTQDVQKDGERENVIAGGISFAQDMIFVTNGYDELLALKSQNGEILWRKRLPSPSRAAPTILDGRVFVTTLDNRLMAFQSQTGESLWEYTGVGENAGLLGAASPAANAATVVPVFSSGEITALRVENGSVAWSDNLASVRNYGSGLESLSDIKAMPLLYSNAAGGGLVIGISFSGRLAAIDEATGMRLWQRDISGSETPWLAGEILYVISADQQLIALQVKDGAILWVTDLPKYADQDDKDSKIRWMGPVMGSNLLIITGSHGEILMVDGKSGKTLKTLKTGRALSTPPIIANETLYLLDKDGTLAAYR